MMTPNKLSSWLLLATFLSIAPIACGDDDDDNGIGNQGGTRAGTSGSSQGGSNIAGSSLFGGNGNDNDAGDGNQPGTGGTINIGGTSNTGGSTVGAAGEQSGGAGGFTGLGGAGGAAAGADAGGAGPDLNDAQILLVLDTLNQGEVDEAYAALPRLADPDVLDFAQLMVTDHSAARQQVAATADTLNLNPSPSATQ
ncbi:MAG TPA: DUF4142 domain-containing protein, partial [Polyangiaceae bacterium]|nr:DUF4142 domain-containing protein [Polyangiaceae bacterium]